MRKLGMTLALVLFVTVMTAGAGSAAAGGNKKLVEGTVYDTTCATACVPECPPPPHCGPITQDQTAKIVCAQRADRLIVCPLYKRTVVCVQAPCPGPTVYPVYSGEGAVVKVRKRGSATVVATLPVVEGHFKLRVAPGYYELRPFLPEPECWSGTKHELLVSPKLKGPVSSELWVANSCVAHPDAAK
jgi:hypothetical protein